MPDVEAIADVATGAMASGAVEPATGDLPDGHTLEAKCLNCGTGLDGPYCRNCGQRAHVHRTLSAFWHDLAHGVLHFEGKIWRTLPLLAWRPGALTRRYIDGQRASFVSPIALFLFSVFLMFAVMHTAGALDFSGTPTGETQSQVSAKKDDALAVLRKDRAKAVAANKPTAVQDVAIRELERSESTERGEASANEKVYVNLAPGFRWLEEPLRHALSNQELLLYKMQTNAYKFSWLLIPISVPFLWLLLLNRKRYRSFAAYDHTVFVTYSLAFVTLLVSLMTIFGKLVGSNDLAVFAVTFIPPLHMYRQLRGAYGLSRFSAAWRAFLLAMFAAIALGLFGMLLLMIGTLD